MTTFTKLCLSAGLTAGLFIGIANAAPYTLDKTNSAVTFNVSHLKLTRVDGRFKDFSGTIDYDAGKLNVLEGMVTIKSIDTANAKRDAHLNEAELFDSAKYPNITFKMTKFEGNKIYGDLTIRDTTRPVVFDSKIADNGSTLNIDATTSIKRSEFGISWEGVFQDNAVGEEVNIVLNLRATK